MIIARKCSKLIYIYVYRQCCLVHFAANCSNWDMSFRKPVATTWKMNENQFRRMFLNPWHMGGNLLTVQSIILVSYFLYFWARFLATSRLTRPKLATFSENIWAPDGLHVSVWTISTFYKASFSEKLSSVAFLTK